jgi:hypothetical protein
MLIAPRADRLPHHIGVVLLLKLLALSLLWFAFFRGNDAVIDVDRKVQGSPPSASSGGPWKGSR